MLAEIQIQTALLTSIATLTAAALGSFIFHWWKRRIRRDQLRRLFRIELQASINALNALDTTIREEITETEKISSTNLNEIEIPIIPINELPTPVIDSYSTELELFSTEELQAIMSFYGKLEGKNFMQEFRKAFETGDEQSLGDQIESWNELEESAQNALNKIESKIGS